MNITLSIDAKTVEAARGIARSLGKSLDRLVQDYLEQLTREADIRAEMEELRRLSLESGGHSGGRRFDREELHGRRHFVDNDRPFPVDG
jgi:hypothetical protein